METNDKAAALQELHAARSHPVDEAQRLEELKTVAFIKEQRRDIDIITNKIEEFSRAHYLPEREKQLVLTYLVNATMWLGQTLNRLNQPNPYPESKNPASPVIEPAADGLKFGNLMVTETGGTRIFDTYDVRPSEIAQFADEKKRTGFMVESFQNEPGGRNFTVKWWRQP